MTKITQCKICGKSFIKKTNDQFCTDDCKEIHNKNYQKIYRKNNIEKQRILHKKWSDKNRDKIKEYRSRPESKELKKINGKEYYLKNKVTITKRKQEYAEKNKEKRNIYLKELYNGDINHKIKVIKRTRIRLALKGIDKCDDTLNLLGCSIDYFKKYIEKQFKKGMSWDNYGTVWHIDHRIPCSWFNLINPEEQKRCFHYSNLQPMFSSENLSKRDRFANPSLNQFIEGIKIK